MLINNCATLQTLYFPFHFFSAWLRMQSREPICVKRGGGREGKKRGKNESCKASWPRGERQRRACLLNATPNWACCLLCPPKLFHQNSHSLVLLSPLLRTPPSLSTLKRISLTFDPPLFKFHAIQDQPAGFLLFTRVILIWDILFFSPLGHMMVQSKD